MPVSKMNSQPNSADSQLRKQIPEADALAQLSRDGGPDYNRLVFEKSPYLLQHAGNPVDWYPWGDDAFETAKRENKPVFLSIGYSTCHWCHVMEHESFEDPGVAALLNEAFICIKVDREERPDIDNLYMQVCQALTGGGGWPLTVIMTPDKRPFFAGTYFPKQSRGQRIGMLDLIPRIADLWRDFRQKLLGSAAEIVRHLEEIGNSKAGDGLDESILDTAYQQMRNQFDDIHGGFGSAPKFPSPHNLLYLLRYWHRNGNRHALDMVEKTLQHMRRGGIFDHVGFGFHRYSTDSTWLLPHFEKMLYDQALQALAYVETYQATGKEIYAKTTREIFEYVLRDMTSSEGGFYSAEDADSEGEEGLFYLWTPEEMREILGEKDGDLIISLFNVIDGGNFVDQAAGMKTGRNILHLKESFEKLAVTFNLTEDEIENKWNKARVKLFEVREKRIHPLKDDKILTDWNGLKIAALAKGAAVLNEPEYARAARTAADFILDKLSDDKGRLFKRYRLGEAGLPGHIDDYAFMVWGLLELYEATFDIKYLGKALELNDRMLEDFWDEKHGGLFFTAKNNDELLVRSKEVYDGALPSGNSVAAMNLLRLGHMTANTDLEDKAIAIGRAFSEQVNRAPMGHAQLLSAMMFAFIPTFEVVIVGRPGADDTQTMLKALQQNYSPNKVVLFRPMELSTPSIIDFASFTEFQTAIDGKATAYVCEKHACNAPTTDVGKMLELLQAS